jgi:hypothetical protein
MNRIILIGNGFDLAHGMPTSYQHFLDDFWKTAIEETLSNRDKDGNFDGDFFAVDKVPPYYQSDYTYKVFKEDCDTAGSQITFKNRFLEIITNKSSIQNWVDIENEYYYLLKESYGDNTYSKDYKSVKVLNRDFSVIKDLLSEYLHKVQVEFSLLKKTERLQHRIGEKIYERFKWEDFSSLGVRNAATREFERLEKVRMQDVDKLTPDLEDYLMELKQIKNCERLQPLLFDSRYQYEFDNIANATLLLNFNYTSTEQLYNDPFPFRTYKFVRKYQFADTIHIHGSLDKSDNNPIIFGYGDELDDDYKQLEKLNKNEYLDNIKSIKYLETDNYKKLLEFIESDEYQVFIFGHSCGTSDRTLLNTLFEHDNCASIKPFYYKHKSEEDSEIYLDNYSDIVRNISRNFNSKVKFRDRVVNKTYCSPLLEICNHKPPAAKPSNI